MPVKDEILVPQNKDTSFDGDVLPGTDGRWNFGSLTKRWRKVIAKIVSAINIEYVGNLKPTRDSVMYTAYGYVPLAAPLTSTSFDGDSFSDTSKTLIDLSSSFGAPQGIRAVNLYVEAKDSGSGSGDCYVILGPDNTADIGVVVSPYGNGNDIPQREFVTVTCNGDGDIYYQIEATGTNTFDLLIHIWGYWL